MPADPEHALSRLHLRSSTAELEDIQKELEEGINYLIIHRFDTLVQVLYRLDVDEHKLKALLRQHPSTDAARIIAALLIERQLQKMRARAGFRPRPDIPEEDAW